MRALLQDHYFEGGISRLFAGWPEIPIVLSSGHCFVVTTAPLP